MRTLALVSQKGGAGKTPLALHLAVAAHRAGLQVAIADLDPQSSAWKWSERRKDHPEAVVTSAEQLDKTKRYIQIGEDEGLIGRVRLRVGVGAAGHQRLEIDDGRRRRGRFRARTRLFGRFGAALRR